jgi:hypothetical protein
MQAVPKRGFTSFLLSLFASACDNCTIQAARPVVSQHRRLSRFIGRWDIRVIVARVLIIALDAPRAPLIRLPTETGCLRRDLRS